MEYKGNYLYTTVSGNMNKMTIEPLIGLDEIKIGLTIKSVHQFLGQPEESLSYDNFSEDFYWQTQLKIKYDTNHKVNYIGIRNLGKL